MGNQQLLPCCAACYDGYDGYGCCLPVQLEEDPSSHRESVFRPSWSTWDTRLAGKQHTPRLIDNDDDSYIENYRFSISGDEQEDHKTTSSPRSTLTSCRHSSFTRHPPLDRISSASFASSQVSDSEGGGASHGARGGMECRSDPSIIRRTTTSQCEREDVDDDIDEIAFLSRSDSDPLPG